MLFCIRCLAGRAAYGTMEATTHGRYEYGSNQNFKSKRNDDFDVIIEQLGRGSIEINSIRNIFVHSFIRWRCHLRPDVVAGVLSVWSGRCVPSAQVQRSGRAQKEGQGEGEGRREEIIWIITHVLILLIVKLNTCSSFLVFPISFLLLTITTCSTRIYACCTI